MLSTVFTLTALLVASASSSPIVVSRQLASAGWAYKGCFTEATGQRALVGKAYFDDLMTHEKCAAACSEFTYFGVEYGRECWCSSTGLNEGSVAVSENDCSFKCPGNPSQICGAGDRLTVYSKGSATSPGSPVPTPSPSAYTAVGCYTDGELGRALVDANYYDDALTVEKCAELCTPYLYYGLEYGRECRCGNVLYNSVAVATGECNFPCAGNAAQLCGAGYRMNLYSLDGSIPGGSSSSSSTVSPSSTSSSESSSSSETTTVSSTEVSTTGSPTSTIESTSESSSTVSSTTTETPTLSSTTISTTESPSTTSTTTSTTTTTTTTTTSEVPVETCFVTSPILNSGFEIAQGTIAANWIQWSAESASTFNVVTNTVTAPHSGLKSYRIRIAASTRANRFSFRQNFEVGARPCADRIYKYEAWVKVGADFPASGIPVYIGTPSGPLIYQTVTSTEWQKIEGLFAIPNDQYGPILSVQVTFPPLALANHVFFDDITMSLTPIGTVLPPI